MKTIIVALSLFGMAYAGGYGLETLGGKGLGLISLGGYGGNEGGYDDGSYKGSLEDGSYRGSYEDGSYKGGDEGSYYGGYGSDLGMGLGKGLELSTVQVVKSQPQLVLVKSDWSRNDGLNLGYGGGDLDLGGDVRHGQYSPMPQQQIRLVGIPVPVKKPYPVPVDKPYTVKIDKPYPVKVERIEKKPYVAKVIRPVIEKTIHVQEHKSYH